MKRKESIKEESQSISEVLKVYQKGSRVASWIFGGALLLFFFIVVFLFEYPTDFQKSMIRFLLALAGALFSLFFVGGILLKGKLKGLIIGAGGGFAIFILIQFIYDPFITSNKKDIQGSKFQEIELNSEKGMMELAKNISLYLEKYKVKVVAVSEFKNRDNGNSRLGRYLSEELITNLFVVSPGKFEVVPKYQLIKTLENMGTNPAYGISDKNMSVLAEKLNVGAISVGVVIDMDGFLKLTTRLISVDSKKYFAAIVTKFNKDRNIRYLQDYQL